MIFGGFPPLGGMLEARESQRRLEVVIENAHHGIVVVDRRGIVQLANPALGRLTGHDYRELIGRRLDWLIPERHRAAHDGYVEDYLKGRGESEILTRGRVIEMQHLDGRKIPVFIRVHETRSESDHFFTAILEDLSAETMLKDRLEEGAHMLRAMADSNPSGLFISDATGTRNVFVNEELCSIYGATEAELLLPGAWLSFIHPEDVDAVHRAMEQALAGQTSGQIVHRVVCKSGRHRWVHVGARPLFRHGTFHGFVGSVVDITRYKNAELEVAAERKRLYEITRMLPASVKYFDRDGRYVFVNAAVERMWKRPMEEFVGRHYSEMLLPDMRRKVQPHLDRAFAGQEVRFQISLPVEGSGLRHFETTYTPHIQDGFVVGMTAAAVDITDLREKQNQLEIYRQMVEGMSEGAALASPMSGEIFYVNPALEEMLGKTSAEIRGNTLSDFAVDLPNRLEFDQRLKLALEKTGAFRSEIILQNKQNRRIDLVLQARIMQLPDGKAVLYILTDVSSIKEAERLAEAERDRATLATAAKSRFIAHVSHEIRNPLNAMLGYTELLLQREEEIPPAMREMLGHIQGAGRGLLRLVGEVLDLEQIEAGRMSVNPAAFSLKDLISELESTMRYRAFQQDLAFEVEVDASVPELVVLDRTRLYQILLNLTSNAAKYSPRGTAARLEINVEQGRLHIHVVDQGPGIPSEFEERLFTPFARAAPGDPKIKGTGLGLFISRQLAQLMGGSLEYERPASGQGSIFCLRLPLVKADALPESVRPAAPVRFDGLKALVVDDSDLNRTVLVAILEMAGCEVWSASSGELAMEICEEIHPDICFIDYHMPGMSGTRTIESLRSIPRLTNLKSVLLSGDIFEQEVTQGQLADFFLLKPYNRGDIQRILKESFEKEREGS